MEEDNYIRTGGNGFFYVPGLSTLQRTEEDCDKLLMPYVPSGMMRIGKYVMSNLFFKKTCFNYGCLRGRDRMLVVLTSTYEIGFSQH